MKIWIDNTEKYGDTQDNHSITSLIMWVTFIDWLFICTKSLHLQNMTLTSAQYKNSFYLLFSSKNINISAVIYFHILTSNELVWIISNKTHIFKFSKHDRMFLDDKCLDKISLCTTYVFLRFKITIMITIFEHRSVI